MNSRHETSASSAVNSEPFCLVAEWQAAVASVRQPHLDRLRALGVSASAIATLNLSHPAFCVTEAIGEPNGLYQPGGGALHVVSPVIESGALVDLVTWRSDQPERWYLRTGVGWLLNADACLTSRWDGHQLSLRATPLDWLRRGARGAWDAGGVVLDWDAPDLSQLRCFDEITCDTDWLAVTLRRALSRPSRLPAIVSAEARRAA